jgi:hypothetical protein
MDQGGEDNWDTVGRPTERSLSPAPTVEEVVPESTQLVSSAGEPRASTKEKRPEPSATIEAVEPVVSHVEEEVPAEARLVDIANLFGAPTVTVVRSSL